MITREETEDDRAEQIFELSATLGGELATSGLSRRLRSEGLGRDMGGSAQSRNCVQLLKFDPSIERTVVIV